MDKRGINEAIQLPSLEDAGLIDFLKSFIGEISYFTPAGDPVEVIYSAEDLTQAYCQLPEFHKLLLEYLRQGNTIKTAYTMLVAYYPWLTYYITRSEKDATRAIICHTLRAKNEPYNDICISNGKVKSLKDAEDRLVARVNDP